MIKKFKDNRTNLIHTVTSIDGTQFRTNKNSVWELQVIKAGIKSGKLTKLS